MWPPTKPSPIDHRPSTILLSAICYRRLAIDYSV
jgi:hypothetical protein